MPHTISPRNSANLSGKAIALGLSPEKIETFARKHGAAHTVKCLTAARRSAKPRSYPPYIPLPKEVRRPISKPKDERAFERQVETYKTELKEAGFILFDWDEDFVDEDTGQVVTIKRCRFNHIATK